ncbi:DUF3810 domain-containing protein [Winogradskyella litorisediminis]|uniref:DUF3810 domain-containing protein n=1 Tax=Winogradskyella litorisediminis TaxID=1156618 RepID=A0ABW3NCI5_9FLAO
MRITKKGALLVFFVLQIIGLKIIRHFPHFVENYYSNGLYVFLSKVMRYTFGWLPISVGDVLYTFAVIYLFRWIWKNFKRIYKDTINWFLDVIATLSIAYFAFHLLWGLNYYRQPLHKSLDLKADYSTEELINFTQKLIEKSNKIHALLADSDSMKVVFNYSKSEISAKVPQSYQKLSQEFPHLKYHPKSLKKSLFTYPLTYMGFSGYLNPFTNEAQVNGLISSYKYPTTSCHEVAHQLGYAAENEANFIGALAAINNEDLYFKYSGYTFALRYCLAEVFRRNPEVYSELLSKLNLGILKNYQEVKDFWQQYQTPIEPFFEKTFDTFLKANNQSAGMKSYSYVVALLVNYFDNKPL